MKKLQKLMRILLSLTFLFSIGCSMGGCAEKPVPDETMMIYPDRISGKLSNNKGMGTQLLEHCLYGHSSNGALGNFPEIAGVSILSTWSVLEPREGEYYFDELDQTVQYWKSQEKSINLRICTDSSMLGYSYEGCPRWMIDKYDIPYVELDYYDGGVVPKFITVDTTNAEYRKHLSAFLDHINEHYQFEEAIEVIEIRAFGCWGEWHTGYEYKDVDERLDAMQYLIDTYCEKFMQNGKLLVLSSSWDHQVEDLYGTGESRYADYLKYSCFDYAFLKPGLGFRRDGAGSLLVYYDLEQRLMQESYRSGKLNAPNGAEFAATYQILQDPEYPFSLMDAINHDIFILRANYSLLLSGVAESLIPAIEEGNTDFIDRANEMLGYRFCVNFIRYPKSVGIGRSFDCKIQIANIAGGRFPYDGYDLKVYLLDGNGNVIASQVDESFTPHNLIMGDIVNLYPRIKIPTSVKEGKYQLAYALVNGTGEPAIEFGNSGKIGNSLMYLAGEIFVEQGGKEFRESVTELSAKEYENYIFDTDSVYEVTIEYMPNQQLKNFCFGTNDCYKISLNTEEEQSNCFRFQDLSGVQGKKTFIMQTGKNGFPKLNIDSERFGEIEVLKVFVEKREKGYYENFEQGSLYTSQSIFHEVRNGTAEIEEGDLGKTLKLHTPNLKARYDAAVTNKGSLYLKGNTSYTVVFDFEARSQVNPGGFYYLDLIDGYEEGASRQEMENLPRKNIGEFYERTDNYVTRKTYTFYTGNFKQASLSFGGVNGVDFSVDNFLIVENTSGFVQEGKDIVAQRNEVPEILYDWGETEGFESGNFFTTPFTFGTLAFGRITQDKMLVIHGKASLWANAETEAANVGWFDFLKSDPDKLPIQGGKKYRLKFYYKVIENNPLSMFKVFFTTFDDEQKNREIILDLSRIGEIIEVDAVFELKESETPYYLMFSMIGGVANIVFDDICIQIES